MKATELIKRLEEMTAQHGDLPVCVVGYLGRHQIDRAVFTVSVDEGLAAIGRTYPEAVKHFTLHK